MDDNSLEQRLLRAVDSIKNNKKYIILTYSLPKLALLIPLLFLTWAQYICSFLCSSTSNTPEEDAQALFSYVVVPLIIMIIKSLTIKQVSTAFYVILSTIILTGYICFRTYHEQGDIMFLFVLINIPVLWLSALIVPFFK